MTQAQINQAKAAAKLTSNQRTKQQQYLINLARYNKVPGFNASKLPPNWKPNGSSGATRGGSRPGAGTSNAAEGVGPGPNGGPRTGIQAIAAKNISDIYKDPAALEQVLKAAGFTGSLDEMKKEAMARYQYAGLKQWVMNQSGQREEVAASPWLQNVGTDNDQNAWYRIIGQITGAIQEGRNPSATWIERGTRMDQEMPWIRDSIDKLGVDNFSLELLADPKINLDPNKPLFDPKDETGPASLSQLTGGQRGEMLYYAGLSPEELINNIYPKYDEYFNRAAGAPAPNGGLMFGQVGYNDGISGAFVNQDGTTNGDLVSRSPIMSDPTYMRAMAYGMLNGVNPGVINGAYGASLNPLMGGGNPGGGQGGNNWLLGASPGWFAEYNWDPSAPWSSSPYFMENMINPALGRVGATAFTGDLNNWFQGQYADYGNIDDATRNRYAALMGYYV